MTRPQAELTDDPLLTGAETAALIGRSTRTVERLSKAGELDAVTVGTGPRPRIFYRQSDVLAHLADRRDRDRDGDHRIGADEQPAS